MCMVGAIFSGFVRNLFKFTKKNKDESREKGQRSLFINLEIIPGSFCF